MKRFSVSPLLKIRKSGDAEFSLSKCIWAHETLSRLVGLLKHKNLEPNEGLLLDPCNQVHMFFMSFGIDAIFLNRDDEIIAVESLKPWRISKIYFKAKKVLEVPYGFASKHQWNQGDKLEILYPESSEANHA